MTLEQIIRQIRAVYHALADLSEEEYDRYADTIRTANAESALVEALIQLELLQEEMYLND